jgi:hypothetical protein
MAIIHREQRLSTLHSAHGTGIAPNSRHLDERAEYVPRPHRASPPSRFAGRLVALATTLGIHRLVVGTAGSLSLLANWKRIRAIARMTVAR